MTGRYWIDLILASNRVLRKIGGRDHGFVTLDEVYEAVAHFRYDKAAWREDAGRGRRLIVSGRSVGGKPLLVVLGDVDRSEGIWTLRTAYRDE